MSRYKFSFNETNSFLSCQAVVLIVNSNIVNISDTHLLVREESAMELILVMLNKLRCHTHF